MEMKRSDILECLTRDRLLDLARAFEVPGLTGRTQADISDSPCRPGWPSSSRLLSNGRCGLRTTLWQAQGWPRAA